MLETILLALAVYVVFEAAVEALSWALNLMDHNSREEWAKGWLLSIPLTEADQQLVERNRELLRQLFPDGNAAEAIRAMSREDRVRTFLKLAEEAAENYGVELQAVRFAPTSEIGQCLGEYNQATDTVSINQDYLLSDDAEVLHHLIGTVFHELRHAQQYRAVTDPNYHYGSEEQLLRWAMNFMEGNYISPDVDFDQYQRQVIEEDARAVAAATVMGF